MSTIRVNPILRYSDIFSEALNLPSENDHKQNIKALIVGLPKKTVLQASAHFAGYFDYESSKFNQDAISFLDNYFGYTSNEVKLPILKTVLDLQRSSATKLQIINTITSLTLFNWALEFCEGSDEITDHDRAAFEITLLKAYLYLNEVLDSKHTNAIKTVHHSGIEGFIRMQFTVALPDYEFSNVNLPKAFTCQIIKAYWLFSHISSHQKYQQLISSLLAKLMLDSIYPIYSFFIDMAFESVKRSEGAVTIDLDRNDPDIEHMERIFQYYTTVTGSESDDFRFLRTNPFYEVTRGEFRIIYPLFVVDKIYKSWYFQFNELNMTLEDPPFKVKALKGEYGKKITEEVILVNALSGVFRSGANIRFGEALCDSNGKEFKQAPDYYVRDSNNVFWFESKDTYLTAQSKASYDYGEIEADLEKKLRTSGISQLVANINRVYSNNLEFDQITQPKKIKFYPILVLHDETFNSPFLNYIVNQWFIEDLQSGADSCVNISNVNPVVILTIDTIINFNQLFRRSPHYFELLLRRYADHHLQAQNNQQVITGLSFFHFAQSFCLKKKISSRLDRELFRQALHYFLMGKFNITD